jgi:plastocyanin
MAADHDEPFQARRNLAWLPLLVTLLLGTAAPAAEPTGQVRGTVRYTGKLPEPRIILTTEGGTIRHQDLVVHPQTRGLRYVFTTLEDAPAQPKVAKAEPVVMDQRDMLFVPRVVAVQHGQAVRFENSDAPNHSVRANSTVPANQLNSFISQGRPLDYVFEPQKAPVLIDCSLHEWMKAWVYVVPHPWFAVTDARGTFRLDRVPPGRYTLLLRHADTGRQERRPITVKAGQTTELTVEWKEMDGR